MVTKYPPIPSILLRDVGELIVGLTMDSIRDQKKKMTPQTLKNFQMDGSNVAQTGGKMSTHMFESQTWTDGGSASPHTLFEESTSADHSYEVATSDIVQDIVSEGFLEAYVTPSGSDDTELHPESDHVNDSDSDYAYGSVGGSVGDSVDDHYDRYGWDHDGHDYDYDYDDLYWC
ncbi:hypothetical protein JCM33374_g3239 [Metschnikowia sp. JCM 33374]|nr:hypothetical protein JCM33374_g3239 [Metschnikowia sp. JCM 33374]